MNENQLKLRTVNELVESRESFYIPAYQRGYRWTKRQVEDLLSDVLEFHQKEKKKSEFYCLQPVVVRKHDQQWELIDGQQRLTTIFIILSYFNKRMAEEFRRELFSIEYATRPDSQSYLFNITLEDKDKNIDFYHIYDAYEVVKEWFSDKSNLVNDIESIFLNRVKVIWYEVNEDIDPVEVFTRLNLGKIPLTNAELVKALFLRTGNFGTDQTRQHLRRLQIAQEWDDMERSLQHDDFWYFLVNDKEYPTRIEHILELVADELKTVKKSEAGEYYVFIAFHRWFNGEFEQNEGRNEEDIDVRWEHVRKYFMLLEEWFNDRHWFHLVGFLINQGVPVSQMRNKSQTEGSKQAFRRYLKRRIWGFISPENPPSENDKTQFMSAISEKVNGWTYPSNNRYIRPALLLFNVATLLRNSNSNLRFQFDSYKKDRWDLEHVRSVMSDKPLRADDQKKWLTSVLRYFTNMDGNDEFDRDIELLEDQRIQKICRDMIYTLTTSPLDIESFDRNYEDVQSYFEESNEGETDNSIANLALLDASTNRSYGNEVFPIKRGRIIALDKEGSFVPLCTKNVFLKYYSTRIDNMMYWNARDSDDYRDAIIEMLAWFFSNDKEVLK